MRIILHSTIRGRHLLVPSRGCTAGSCWWVVFNAAINSMTVIIRPGPQTLYHIRGDSVFPYRYPYQTARPVGVMLPLTTELHDAVAYAPAMRPGVYITFHSMYVLSDRTATREYHYSVNTQWRPADFANQNYQIPARSIVEFCVGVANYLCCQLAEQQDPLERGESEDQIGE